MRTLLSVEHGGTTKRYILSKGRIRVGRAQDCEIRIGHPQISRIQATFERQGRHEYRISDGDAQGSSSRNGTYVNGKPATADLLQDGDVICFGPNVRATFLQVRVGVSAGPRDTVPVEQEVASFASPSLEVPTQIVPRSSFSSGIDP